MMKVRAEGVKPSPRIGVPFAPIPLDVASRRDVSPSAKLVFATVANQARMRKADVSDLTNRQISTRAGLTVAAVRRALDQLASLGLVRRLYGASPRIRWGVAITYQASEGCAPATSPPDPVAQTEQPGCAPASNPGCAPGASDLLRGGEEESPKTIPPSLGKDEDAAARVTDGPTAAQYLRDCIAAGKRGESMPEPPTAKLAPPVALDVAPKLTVTPPVATPIARPVPQPPQYGFLPQVGRLVRDLAERLKAPDVGPTRVGPAKLARQLAEMRRRTGRRE